MQNITCTDLDAEVGRLQHEGYRLNMIMPADEPRVAYLSNGEAKIKLSADPNSRSQGRAGMEYRDLIPGRLDGKVIASHIKLKDEGEVPDYVHYHKIDFQLIFCIMGRIRVVYEDQGPPFWIEAGDAVLQPPEIRHRVLECTVGAEVIEITMPAEHETWVDHEMTLPTSDLRTGRLFGDQPFARLTGATGVQDALVRVAATVSLGEDVRSTLRQIGPMLNISIE